MIYNKDTKMFIVTDFEMEELKRHALRFMGVLPDNPETALITVAYIKELMEEEIGKKVLGISILAGLDAQNEECYLKVKGIEWKPHIIKQR